MRKYLYLLIMSLILASVTTLYASRILIDFGDSTRQTAGNWNNVTNLFNGGTPSMPVTYSNLIDTNGASTQIDLVMSNWYAGSNQGGVTTGAFDYAASATRDNAFIAREGWGSATGTSFVYFTDLTPTKIYSFTIFASRVGVSDNRETEYVLTGQNSGSATLNTANNYDQRVSISSLQPTSAGVILMQVGPGENNSSGDKFGYLGVVDLFEIPEPVFIFLVPVLSLFFMRKRAI